MMKFKIHFILKGASMGNYFLKIMKLDSLIYLVIKDREITSDYIFLK